MVVRIKTDDKYGKTLTFSAMPPFEYVIVSKETYEEPKTGTGKFGFWARFNVRLFEYASLNPQTGDKEKFENKEGEIMGMFTGSEVLAKEMTKFPLGVKLKVTMQKGQSGKNFYVCEPIDKVASGSTNKNATPSMSLDDKIKNFIRTGMAAPSKSAVALLTKEYDVTEEFIIMRWDELL